MQVIEKDLLTRTMEDLHTSEETEQDILKAVEQCPYVLVGYYIRDENVRRKAELLAVKQNPNVVSIPGVISDDIRTEMILRGDVSG